MTVSAAEHGQDDQTGSGPAFLHSSSAQSPLPAAAGLPLMFLFQADHSAPLPSLMTWGLMNPPSSQSVGPERIPMNPRDHSLSSLLSYHFVVAAGEAAVAPGWHPEDAMLRHVSPSP